MHTLKLLVQLDVSKSFKVVNGPESVQDAGPFSKGLHNLGRAVLGSTFMARIKVKTEVDGFDPRRLKDQMGWSGRPM